MREILIFVVTMVLSTISFADNTFKARGELHNSSVAVADSYRLSSEETVKACMLAVKRVSEEVFPNVANLGEILCSYKSVDASSQPAFHRKGRITPIGEILHKTSFYIRRPWIQLEDLYK